MLPDLSLRHKIPLRSVGVIVITAVLVTASLTFRAYENLRRDVVTGAAGLGRVLAVSLVPELLHDDVWRAYELLIAPRRAHVEGGRNQPALLVVLDPQNKVYVSSAPDRFPMLSDARQLGQDFLQLALHIAQPATQEEDERLFEPPQSDFFYVVVPIVSDGVGLGHLVIGYPRSIFLPRFYDNVRQAGLITLAVLALLLPVSWYWSVRLARPLVALARYMKQAGSRLPDPERIHVQRSHDEIGELGRAFRRMLRELKEKESLERRIVASDRLAAIGRLSAGIAHEINNPLGGMLTAINTFRRHGVVDPLLNKTLSLLERGLDQIKNTVAALLVESRVSTRALTAHDIEDVRTLILPDLHSKSAQLEWENDIDGEIALPSTQVRQILLNLMLNAAAAVGEGGSVSCRIHAADAELRLTVTNDGRHIPAERLPFMFEPFAEGGEAAGGLGLWVTYQIVQHLKGSIDATSKEGETRFRVVLPLAGGEP